MKPGVSCDECGCDPSRRVQRPSDDEEDEPRVTVHRGTIGSGELVIEDAAMRDQLAKKFNILCFETEAAGALADFPCLVIRRDLKLLRLAQERPVERIRSGGGGGVCSAALLPHADL